jgi:hypothetical protein
MVLMDDDLFVIHFIDVSLLLPYSLFVPVIGLLFNVSCASYFEMPPSLTVNLWRPNSGSTDHLHPFVVPSDVPCETTFRGVKERIRAAGGPPACYQRLELVYELHISEIASVISTNSNRVLYITLKDNETFLSNPYVYNKLMTKSCTHVTFVLSTWRGNLNELVDPFVSGVPDAMSIFRNKDAEINSEEDWWWLHNLVLGYGRLDYERLRIEYDD